MHRLLKTDRVREILRLLITLIFSLIVSEYVAATNLFLIPLTAIYIMQTAIGNVFYQGMQRLLVVMVIIIAAFLAIHSMDFFYKMTHDVLIGALIGMVSHLFLFPTKPDMEFREKILPVIKTFDTYFSKIIDQLLQQKSEPFDNTELENTLLMLPDWVYERGFDSVLKKGYQFFLIKIEQISDVLMSMHHLSRYQYDKELIAKIRPALLPFVESTNQFFASIITVLELKTLPEEPSDLDYEFTELQKQFFSIVPSHLELLEIRRDDVYLAAFIYNLRDLRKLLLKMGEALR